MAHDPPALLAALAYISRGWRVFPVHGRRPDGRCTCRKDGCSSPAKHPVTKRGLIDATAEEAKVRSWWHRWAWANVAVATGTDSAVAVLDVDVDKGGAESLDKLEAEYGSSLRDTLTSHTGGGGLHLVYAHPGGDAKVKTRARAFGPGLDVRGDGGYIVAPPSVHISGHPYAWENPDQPTAPFPSWLAQRLEARRIDVPPTVVPFRRRGDGGTPYGLTALERLVDELSGAPEGVRNDTLNAVTYSVARLAAGGELDLEPSLAIIQQTAADVGLEPLEIRRTIASATGAGADKPKSAPPRTPPAAPARPSLGLTARGDQDGSSGPVTPAAAADTDTSTPDDEHAVELDRFLAEDEPDYDWLIEGLLERGDRTILTGPEGGGKSTLLRQLSVQGGAGIHPFTLEEIDPLRVLYIDLENSRAHVRRQLRPLRLAAGGRYQQTVHIVVEPQGMDLFGHPPDAEWLEARITATRPELVIIGPLYKLAAGDPTSEEVARRVSAVLDDLRVRHQFALIIEAHSPHGGAQRRPERPYGASMWMRWPEFGLHLTQTGGLLHWRGDRDEREWPTALKRGGAWPWTAETNPRELLWNRILGVVDTYGRVPTIRLLAVDLESSKSAVNRAIRSHQQTWDSLKASLGEVEES